MIYKVVTVPAEFWGDINEAAAKYEGVINAQAAEGWKLVEISNISSVKDRVVKTGCLKKETVYDRDHSTVLIFGKE